MGSGLSHEAADTQQHIGVSSTEAESQAHENHHDKKTTVTSTSTQLSNLPHDYEAILKDADTVVDKSSIDQLYAGVFLNKKRKKYWVDNVSHANCFMVFARDLSITWGEDNRYWQWPNIKETSEVVIDAAEILNVCWLEIHGRFEMTKLTPGIKYEVVFVVMLKDPAYGWEVPVNIRLTLPDGNKQQHKEYLMEKPRSRWFEIPVGEFIAEERGGCVEFSLYEYEGGVWKRGLLVKGAAIRPKI
ncbi:lectin-like [Rutidosis leptorrhynchoides]|uniref:lectin-like n=1 Tax=Rutidosis leptorrhynchoides TaxID=125765 RepID=UPI003A99A2DF